MTALRSLVLCSWLAAAACSSDGGALPDAGADAQLPAELQARIDVAVGRIEADRCFLQADTSACEWADYEVGPEHVNMAVSTGEAILIVDEFGPGFHPQLVRYRNRVLGFYEINGDALEAVPLSVRLPKQLGDVLVSFAGPEFLPASVLLPIARAVSASYRAVPLLFLGHGGVIFGHLVELAPEQPLVLVDLRRLMDLPLALCQRVDDATLAAATAHFTAVASSLRQVMRAHNVRFVNASFGTTAQTLATGWPQLCGGAAPANDVVRRVLHVLDPLYEALFNTEGVVTAQAGADLGDPADFPFDQVSASFGNRVRVGFISSRASGLDELGRGTVQKTAQFPRDGDADVYLNWGCEPLVGCADLHYEMVGEFGLSAGPAPLMSSSYVTPLAVGRLIHLRNANHRDVPMTNALIDTLEQELTPPLCGRAQPCVYQDPIAHRQLEVYRRMYK